MKTSFNPLSIINKIDEDGYSLKTCWPFMPYIGEQYETALIKVMVIGKATYGWGREKVTDNLTTLPKKNIAEELEALTKDFIIKKVASFYSGGSGYSSSFWQRTYTLVSALLERDDELRYERKKEKSPKCFNSICWNNVFKFGSLNGNPSEKLINLLINEDMSLVKDINTLNPDLVIFSTGTYDEYLKK